MGPEGNSRDQADAVGRLDDEGSVGDIDPALFRNAFARFATGVTVLTTRVGKQDHAMTANSVTSVSLDPVLVLACVEVESRFYDAIIESGLWAINMLPATARATASWLATRGRPLHGQLDRIPHHPGELTGVALLDGALASLECRTRAVYPGGDHVIVLGDVLSISSSEGSDEALSYYRGRYGSIS